MSDPFVVSLVVTDPAYQLPAVRLVTVEEPRVLRSLTPGPQGGDGPPGPRGDTGPAGPPAAPQLVYQIQGAASYTAQHGRSSVQSTRLLTPSGEEVETDVLHAPGQTTLVFATPFTGTLYVG